MQRKQNPSKVSVRGQRLRPSPVCFLFFCLLIFVISTFIRNHQIHEKKISWNKQVMNIMSRWMQKYRLTAELHKAGASSVAFHWIIIMSRYPEVLLVRTNNTTHITYNKISFSHCWLVRLGILVKYMRLTERKHNQIHVDSTKTHKHLDHRVTF